MTFMNSPKHLVRTIAVTTALTALLLSGCSKGKEPAPAPQQQPQPAAAGPQMMNEQQRLAMGKAIFNKKCASCHGEEGKGGGAGPSLKRPDFVYGRTAEAIAESIRNGRPKGMPAQKDVMQDVEIDTLTAYILSLK